MRKDGRTRHSTKKASSSAMYRGERTKTKPFWRDCIGLEEMGFIRGDKVVRDVSSSRRCTKTE